MKVECVKKTIDLNKIHWAIECFRENHNGKYPSYIIMGYETKAALINDYYCLETVIKGSINDLREENLLFGISVAFNKGLKMGEVDIV